MKIIKPVVKIVDAKKPEDLLRKLNRSARKCYQSEPNGVPDEKLVSNVINSGHTSVLEHEFMTFDIITDRGVLAELTRHRMAGYSVESTRYVKYNNNNMEFIEPISIINSKPELYELWKAECEHCEETYRKMMEMGAKAQEARQVLNNSLKTEIRMTANIRSLRNMFYLRCDNSAHPHIKQIMIPLLMYLKGRYPVIFDNLRRSFDPVNSFIDHPERAYADWDYTFQRMYLPKWEQYVIDETIDKPKKIELMEE